VVLNFTPVVRYRYRIGVPCGGDYAEIFNSDSSYYGGSNVGNWGTLTAAAKPWMGFACSLELTLPPLGALILRPGTDHMFR
jgi:1,4-alpha-glucan branching enzyme